MRNQIRIKEIERIPEPSREVFLTELAPTGYPFIFRSRLFRPVDWEQILDRVNKQNLRIKVRTGNYHEPDTYLTARKYEDVSLTDYIIQVSSGGSLSTYAGNQILPTNALDSFGFSKPKFYTQQEFEPTAAWLGPRGSITPLHKDSTDNFAQHFIGRKRWILFPVRDIPLLSMTRAMDRPDSDFAPSRIDIRNPDITKFPDFVKAIPIETIISPGETLYLPAGWAHYVENLEPTLMLNTWLSLKCREPAVIESYLGKRTR